MSAADHGPAGSSLTREQVLDELDFLAGLAPADYQRATAVHVPLTRLRA